MLIMNLLILQQVPSPKLMGGTGAEICFYRLPQTRRGIRQTIIKLYLCVCGCQYLLLHVHMYIHTLTQIECTLLPHLKDAWCKTVKN